MRTLSLCKVEQEMLADIAVKYQASNATFFFLLYFVSLPLISSVNDSYRCDSFSCLLVFWYKKSQMTGN